jgi:hypothetical protein
MGHAKPMLGAALENFPTQNQKMVLGMQEK